MFKKISLVFAAFATLTQCNNQNNMSGAKLIEKVESKEGELVIPYEKYVLDNGLTLVIHEDHSDPLIHVDVTYHVGSNREEVGKSGFAHFFEHMMFQGSDNVGDEQHFKIVSEAGGDLNGTTNTDRTNYFETLPNNYLERALWLEADRMGFLLDAVTQKKFEVQRATVKNERGQRYDNRPYGLVHEKLGEHLYPYGHPYSWSTIGYVEDLDRVNVEDLKKFFLRWYGPNNAVLTVGGDVNAKEVVKLATKYFGSIPRGPEVENMEKVPAKLDADRYVSYEDQYIIYPMFVMTMPTVYVYHPDEAPLDVLADILGGGKSSILYKNFIKAQKAVQANAHHPAQELAAQFMFTVIPYPGITLSVVEKMVREALKEFEERGVSQDDLDRTKGQMEARMINGLATVHGKVSSLASYQTFLNDANYTEKDIDRYRNVTKEDVMRVYNQYIKDKPALILSVYPKGQKDLIAREDNYSKPTGEGYEAPKDEYTNLTYNKPKDNFDRSKMPPAGDNPVVKIPEYWTENFENGLKVIGSKNSEIPTVTIQLNIEAGRKIEPVEKAGLSDLVASMMNESTENYTPEDMSSELQKLGSSIHVGSSKSYITLSIHSLVKNLDKTLELAQERLLKPAFKQEDFARVKQQALKQIANQSTQPGSIARDVFRKLLYENDHILSYPDNGTEKTVQGIKLEDVKNFYAENLSPTISNLVIVGDVDKDEVLPKMNFLKEWEGKDIQIATTNADRKIEKTTIFLVDQPGAAQSEIRIGYPSLPYDATGDYYKSGLMNYALGGAFNSRINLNLREDKGYTYGARSGFSGDEESGIFYASAGVKRDVTDSSIIEFVKEIKEYRDNGITAEELMFTQNSIGQSQALSYEALGQKAGFLREIIQYNLDKDFVKEQQEILQKLRKEEVDALAKKYLAPEKMIILVVGDKVTVKEGLDKLGYEVIELSKDGKPVNALLKAAK